MAGERRRVPPSTDHLPSETPRLQVPAVVTWEYAERFRVANIVCVPMVARGRWIGVISGDRDGRAPTLQQGERELLWTLGKTAALASMARVATRQHEKALPLQHPSD